MSIRKRASEVDVTVISGLSGAGRSEAAKALEDLGWFVIDNLPPQLISKMLSLALAPGNDIQRMALVIDARGGTFFDDAMRELSKLRRDLCNFRLIFLEASDEMLERRFESTRRRHPLAEASVAEGIHRERDLMTPFREGADLIIDTTDLSVRELRKRLGAQLQDDSPIEGLKTTVISFGYKFGLPLDADVILDVRFLPNPHWVDDLRPLSGLDDPVRAYVMQQDGAIAFLERSKDLFAVLMAGFQDEGRHYLTVAVGCTGGRHRSVVLAEEFGAFMNDKGFPARIIHRDIERTTRDQ
jgi:RNase adapter protein RapZ